MSELSALQQAVGEWGEKTFPMSTSNTIIRHIRDEVEELHESPYRSQERAEECADILMLLLHICHREGFDLMAEAHKKFAVNQTRIWSTDSGNGYVKHDQEASS